ncbi:MAG: amino acid permease [Gammaproteobacteria bacterium]
MKEQLSRSLKPRHITMISIGGIIGAGLFVGSSAAINAAGPIIILSYVLTGALILLVMRMLGEMAVAHPEVRSFTDFARLGLGNGVGFVAGWLYWYFWIVTVPIEAIAGAKILQAWVPLPIWEIGVVLMAAMTAVNLMSTRSYGEFEFWFSSIKVAAILAFILVAGAWVCGLRFGVSPPGAGSGFANLTAHGFAPHGVAAMLGGCVTVFFALTGAEITTVAAAESEEPSRAIAKLTTTLILRIIAFYVGSIFLILCVIPWDSIPVGESPFVLALSSMGVSWAGAAMSFIVLTAVLSCLNSAFYVCSRVLFQLADKGDAPPWMVVLNARRVPTRSVWVSAVAGVVGVLAATFAPGAVFAFLVSASGAVIVFVYITIAVAQIRLRRRRESEGAPNPPLQMWGFPWLSWVAVVGMSAVLVAMAVTPSQQKDLYFSLLALAVAVGAYLTLRARRSKSRDIAPSPIS